MIIVSNTTPLIGLASIQRFELLKHLFGELPFAIASRVEDTGGE